MNIRILPSGPNSPEERLKYNQAKTMKNHFLTSFGNMECKKCEEPFCNARLDSESLILTVESSCCSEYGQSVKKEFLKLQKGLK